MAKSARSKSLRKAKAAKRATVFQPAVDARIQRLAQRLNKNDNASSSSPVDAMVDEKATSLEGLPKRTHNRKVKAPFSAYGLSRKEMRF